jgi:U3 small nucleolar RNA-associated protein 10
MSSIAKYTPTQQFISAVLAICEPQAELQEFSEAVVNVFLNLPYVFQRGPDLVNSEIFIRGMNAELTAACKWYGIEKVLVPLVTSTISRFGHCPGCPKNPTHPHHLRISEPSVSELLENLIASPGVPDAVLTQLTSSLIHCATADSSSFASRRLLAIVYQRHSSTAQKVAKEIIEHDKDLTEPVEQLILSLSVVREPGQISRCQSNCLLIHLHFRRRASLLRMLHLIQMWLLPLPMLMSMSGKSR